MHHFMTFQTRKDKGTRAYIDISVYLNQEDTVGMPGVFSKSLIERNAKTILQPSITAKHQAVRIWRKFKNLLLKGKAIESCTMNRQIKGRNAIDR